MTLNEILDRCVGLDISTKRTSTDEKVELVFYNKDIDEWNRIFINILGPAAKPADVKPTANDLRLTGEYGGINSSQTLFTKEFDEEIVIAMFWPWQTEEYTTLKMFLLPKGSVDISAETGGACGSIFCRIWKKIRRSE